MIKSLFLQPLGPALILALGGLFLQLITRGAGENSESRLATVPALQAASFPGRSRIPQIPLALLLVLSAGVVLVLLRSVSSELRWAWQPLTVAGSELGWRVDGWNWLIAFLILLLTGTALLLQDNIAVRSGSTSSTARTLWLGAAALAFVFSTNVVTMASCWMLLDAALALRLGAGESEEPAGRAWSFLSLTGLLLLGVLLLLGEGGIRTTLARGPFDQVELGLLWLAALIRAGVYPFHLWLTERSPRDMGTSVALHLIVPMTGLWLLARVHEIAGPTWARHPEWAALGALALLGSALAAWTAEDHNMAWRWIAINRASVVVLAAFIADTAGPAALVWTVVTFGLGSALLAVGRAGRARWGWNWPIWLGALTVWGLPGTPGLLARSALVLPAKGPSGLLLFGVIVAAETLLVATLWELATGERREAATGHLRYGTLFKGHPAGSISFLSLGLITILLAVPTLTWGVAPQQLGSLLGLPPSAARELSLLHVLAGARRSVWVTLIISGLTGVGLGMLRRRIFSGMRGWQQGIMAVVGLEWLYQTIASGFAFAGSSLRYFATLGEGEGYVGWLLLASIILWVLLRG